MRKYLIIVLVAFVSLISKEGMAQGLSFGIEVGLHNNNPQGNAFNFHCVDASIGGRMEYAPGGSLRNLYYSMGLKLTIKRWHKTFMTKNWYGDSGIDQDLGEKPEIGRKYLGDAGPNYLELPVRIGYKFRLSDKCYIMPEFGPWVGVGLFGRSKYYVYRTLEDEPEVVKETCFSKDGYRRFEVGIGGRIGVEIKRHWQIWAGYDYQLNTIAKETGNRNQTFSVSASYMF